MNDTSNILSIIAYYLSEYDVAAVKALGYTNRTDAFKKISVTFNRDNNYLKLRRDEFDALPNSNSHRNGWRNRPAAQDVVSLAAHLNEFSFDEITMMVKTLIDNQHVELETVPVDVLQNNVFEYTEEQIEHIINFEDHTAGIKIKSSDQNVRVYNHSIIIQLKKLYKGTCQICGCNPIAKYGTDICEAHHIAYFAESFNNNASNIVVLCPNHHSLMHKLKPSFDRDTLEFKFFNGMNEKIKINLHL